MFGVSIENLKRAEDGLDSTEKYRIQERRAVGNSSRLLQLAASLKNAFWNSLTRQMENSDWRFQVKFHQQVRKRALLFFLRAATGVGLIQSRGEVIELIFAVQHALYICA